MSMTLEQSEQQAVTIRVVFDGAPHAGKSAAVQALSASTATEIVTQAHEHDDQNVWFEWMTYGGGQYEGQPIRVELVTVPGEDSMADRRRHLLAWSDVVVFVADSTEAGFEASAEKFDDLRTALESRTDVPVVVVANKRDLRPIVPMTVMRERLGLSGTEWLVEGVAVSGGGIQEALIYAVRSALAGSVTRLAATSSDDLLTQLRAVPVLTESIVDDEESADLALIRGARLNKDGVADGAAIVIMQEHWRLLVDVANGRSDVFFADSDDAAAALELATWGLIVGSETPAELGPAEQYRQSCQLRRTMEIDDVSTEGVHATTNEVQS